LYGGGTKEEGRRALAARNSLDEILLGINASDMVNDDLGVLESVKKGIAMENLAEKMQILEDLSASSKQPGMSMKRAMVNILTDADSLNRFTPDHQAIMKAAASGFGFLAERRFKKIVTAIQQQVQAVQAA
jgi:hypothetical protein